jgi:hypothetical protein
MSMRRVLERLNGIDPRYPKILKFTETRKCEGRTKNATGRHQLWWNGAR